LVVEEGNTQQDLVPPALSTASPCAHVHAHSHYDPRPAPQAAQKRAPEADPMFQLAQDRQLIT
jgi:hypothetical protein